jgi:hypothetical protein
MLAVIGRQTIFTQDHFIMITLITIVLFTSRENNPTHIILFLEAFYDKFIKFFIIF